MQRYAQERSRVVLLTITETHAAGCACGFRLAVEEATLRARLVQEDERSERNTMHGRSWSAVRTLHGLLEQGRRLEKRSKRCMSIGCAPGNDRGRYLRWQCDERCKHRFHKTRTHRQVALSGGGSLQKSMVWELFFCNFDTVYRIIAMLGKHCRITS